MEIHIRDAQEADLEQLVCLRAKLQDYLHSLDAFYKKSDPALLVMFRNVFAKSLDNKHEKALVVLDGDRIVGYFTGRISRPKSFEAAEKIGWVVDTFIEENYREQGLTNKLAQAASRWFIENNVDQIMTRVDYNNNVSRAVCETFGLKPYQIILRREL